MSKNVLDRVSKLESINVSKPELDVSIDDEFGETENLATKMERIAETRFLALLRSQSFYWLQVHILRRNS